MVNEPSARSPKFRPGPPHPLRKSFQIPHLKFLVDLLTPGNQFPVHNSLNVHETDQHCFHIRYHMSDFFGPG